MDEDPNDLFRRRSPNSRPKWILAPMVRGCCLATRIECLKYGADHVYTEETVDLRLKDTSRELNSDFNTIEYRQKLDRSLVFATCKEERPYVSLQLGTANSVTALEAAMKVLPDVAAIDVNMGCPKSFSVKGGMGAALLSTPAIASDILRTLRRNLPSHVPVTCKIRMFDDHPSGTREFAQLCERSGANAIALHARKVHHRPSHAADWTAFECVKSAVSIPFIANGDFLTQQQAMHFEEMSDSVDALMFARGALWDPSIFYRPAVPVVTVPPDDCCGDVVNVLYDEPPPKRRRRCVGGEARDSDPPFDASSSPSCTAASLSPSPSTAPLDLHCGCARCGLRRTVNYAPLRPTKNEVIAEFLKTAVCCGTVFQSMKWMTQEMLSQDGSQKLKAAVQTAKTTATLLSVFDLGDWYTRQLGHKGWSPSFHTLQHQKLPSTKIDLSARSQATQF